MNNTLWLFGCSFTENIPVSMRHIQKKDNTHHTYSDKELSYHWTTLLRDKVFPGYELKNYGRRGHGMRSITYHLLNYLPYIQKDDVVIVGFTSHDRETYVLNPSPQDYGLDIGFFDYVSRYLVTSHGKTDKWTEDTLYSLPISSIELANTLSKHYDSTCSASKYNFNTLENDSILNQHLIHKVLLTLQKVGVCTYTWEHTLWQGKSDGTTDFDYKNSYFENYFIWSNDEIHDYHWSPNGNYAAALFFKWCIVNNYSKFKLELLPTYLRNNTPTFEHLPYS